MTGLSAGLGGGLASNTAGLRDRLFDLLPVAIYTTDPEGRITFYNEAAAELWGVRPEIGKSEFCGSWKLYWPDGTPLPHDECPMALALKERRPVRGMEAVAERPDGARIPFIPYPAPLFDEEGALVGGVNMLMDISEWKRAEQEAQRLAAMVESSHDAIVGKNLDGVVTNWNASAERLFGYKAEEVIGKSILILIPADRADEETSILARLRRGERVEHFETVRRRKDGSLVEVSLTISPIRNAKGEIIGASKIAREITEQRLAEDRQELLLREMNHRVKNLFALTGGIVSLSARSATTPQELRQSILDRLNALARAHNLIRPDPAATKDETAQDTTLEALLGTIFAPYVEDGSGDGPARLSVGGPEVRIGGKAITNLALVLHELATNAAKYGALSTPEGRIDIEWSLVGDELAMSWREGNGPSLDGPPPNDGFGSLLARRTVEDQYGGKLERDWSPEGLAIHLTLPLQLLRQGV